VTDGVAHAAHLAIASLVDHDAEHARGDGGDTGRRRHLATVQDDSLPKTAQSSGPRDPADLNEILLFYAEPRMSEQLSELAVICEKKETFCLLVEPPDRKHARLRRDEVQDRRSPLGVVSSSDHTGGFVEQVVDQAGHDSHRSAVHSHEVTSNLDPAA